MLGGKFDAAISFEPTSNGIKEGDATVSSTLGQTTSIAGGSAKLRRNTFDGVADYTVKLGSFASKASVGYLSSTPVGNLTGAQALSPMNVWQVGAQTTYTGLFTGDDTITVGANAKGGSVTDKYGFKPKGGRDALAYIVGAAYTTGPYVLGASFFDSQESNGKVGAAGKGIEGHTLSEYGVAVGANYIVAKPLSLFVQYLYGNVHGAAPTATTAAGPGAFPHGNGHVQAIALGATFKW